MIDRDTARRIAGDYHGGQGSALYAFASTGTYIPGAEHEAADAYNDTGDHDARALLEHLDHVASSREGQAAYARSEQTTWLMELAACAIDARDNSLIVPNWTWATEFMRELRNRNAQQVTYRERTRA